MQGILGRKIGMTQLFTTQNELIPVTVIATPVNSVLQVKTEQTDGYNAVKLGAFDKATRLVNKPSLGNFHKAKSAPKYFIREIRNMAGAFRVGDAIAVQDVFTAGQHVDVTGVTKGKGFAGVIKRYHFSRGPMAHGSGYHRGVGSLGSVRAKRIFKNKKMPKHMGHVQRTALNQQIVQIDQGHNLLLVKGAVPGPSGQCVIVKATVKQKKQKPLPAFFYFPRAK